jgi:Protein of unknown function (DUF3168)
MPNLNITTALLELQTAVVTRLKASVPHMALVSSVYDYVPQDAAYPYENIGAISETWADGFTEGFRLVSLQLDTWSRYHGRKEAVTIQASQIGLLNRQQAQLTLATLRLIFIRLEYNDVLEDPDGITWHGVTRYVALVEATS